MYVHLSPITFKFLAGATATDFLKWPQAATIALAGGTILKCLVARMSTLRVLLGRLPQSLNIAWDASHDNFRCAVRPLIAFSIRTRWLES